MFVNIQDLHLLILPEELQEITRGDNMIIDTGIAAAIQEARMYLFDSFEVDNIFTVIGAARNIMLVNVCADIALYFITARCQAGQNVDDRKARYDRAISILKAIMKNETYTDLERKKPTAQVHIGFGSNPKRNNYF
jgi:phage gp36-like protein